MPIYVLSTLAVAAAVAANLRIRGIPIVLLGAVSNFAAIVANGGYMPASAGGHGGPRTAGQGAATRTARFVPDPALPWLTDIFALPSWLPYTNVFSIGDVLIGLGVVVVIASAMRTPVAPTIDARTRGPSRAPAASLTAPNTATGDPAAPNSSAA